MGLLLLVMPLAFGGSGLWAAKTYNEIMSNRYDPSKQSTSRLLYSLKKRQAGVRTGLGTHRIWQELGKRATAGTLNKQELALGCEYIRESIEMQKKNQNYISLHEYEAFLSGVTKQKDLPREHLVLLAEQIAKTPEPLEKKLNAKVGKNGRWNIKLRLDVDGGRHSRFPIYWYITDVYLDEERIAFRGAQTRWDLNAKFGKEYEEGKLAGQVKIKLMGKCLRHHMAIAYDTYWNPQMSDLRGVYHTIEKELTLPLGIAIPPSE